MTLAARLDDFEMTLEHLLMDVFVSKSFPFPRARIVPTVPKRDCVPIVTEASRLQLCCFYTSAPEGKLWWGGLVPKCPVTQNRPHRLTGRGVAFLNDSTSQNECTKERENTPQERSKPLWYTLPGGV